GQGDWSTAFTYRLGEAERVVRFSALREDFDKDAWAQRYGSPALPIPRQLELGTAFDGYYAIAERAPGGYLDHLEGEQMRATLPSLLAVLDAMRLADVAGTQGYGLWDG